MTKLLKTNTAAENLELVRACGTREEMTELLNTATIKMLDAISEEATLSYPKSFLKIERINFIVNALFKEKEIACEAEKISVLPTKERFSKLLECENINVFRSVIEKCSLKELKAFVKAFNVKKCLIEENMDIFDTEETALGNLVYRQLIKRLEKKLAGEEVNTPVLEVEKTAEVLKFEVGATYEKGYEVVARTDNEVIFKNKIGNFLRGVISIHDGAEYSKIGIDNYFLDGVEENLSARMKIGPAREISLDEAEENLNDATVELKELESADHSLDDLKKYDFPNDDYDNYSYLIVPLRKVEEYRRIIECLSNYFDELEKNSDNDIPQIMSELESKTPEEKQEILENCADDFLEDLCWAYGYKPNEDKKIMASLLARSQKSVQAKIQAIEEFLPIARENFNFFTHIGKKEQAESYSLCLRRLEAWLKFYQQEVKRSNKL